MKENNAVNLLVPIFTQREGKFFLPRIEDGAVKDYTGWKEKVVVDTANISHDCQSTLEGRQGPLSII